MNNGKNNFTLVWKETETGDNCDECVLYEMGQGCFELCKGKSGPGIFVVQSRPLGKMKVTIKKLTDKEVMDWAFDKTVRSSTNVSLDAAYRMEHSPMRTQIYWIDFENIPLAISTHFIRHNIGITHFALTHRDDRGGTETGRDTDTQHGMFLNAQSLISIAQARLCFKAHPKARAVMMQIVKQLELAGDPLAKYLVPSCVYRNGLCKEGHMTCGFKAKVLEKYSYYSKLFDI